MGLDAPVPGVKVTVTSNRPGQAKHTEAVLLTGDDGRYSGTIARRNGEARDWLQLEFEKDGYSNPTLLGLNRGHKDFTLNRKIRWEEMSILPYKKGDSLDQGMREVLSSDEWETEENEQLLGFLFKHQDRFRPAFRRIIQDAYVGKSAGTGSMSWEIQATEIFFPRDGSIPRSMRLRKPTSWRQSKRPHAL